MLVVDFVTRLNTDYSQLVTRLTVANLIQFGNLASEVYTRADPALKMTSSDTRILPFLRLALELELDFEDYQALWNLTFPSLPFAHLNPSELIVTHPRAWPHSTPTHQGP